MTQMNSKIIDVILDCAKEGRDPNSDELNEMGTAVREPAVVTEAKDALDITCALIEILFEKNAIRDDQLLTYSALSLVRYLREKLPPGDKIHERWKRLVVPFKIDYTLSDRARYEPWIAHAAGELRKAMRTLVIKNEQVAFSILNFLRQTAIEAAIVMPDSLLHRYSLALLDYLERNGAPIDPEQPSYANGGRVPKRSVFDVRIRNDTDS
jgi:hypothetical protein